MKIKIKANKVRFSIPLPLSFIKSSLAAKFLKKQNIEMDAKLLYKEIRKYIKEKGHFTLLEVDSPSSNTKIKITV